MSSRCLFVLWVILSVSLLQAQDDPLFFECPTCRARVGAADARCPSCGQDFEPLASEDGPAAAQTQSEALPGSGLVPGVAEAYLYPPGSGRFRISYEYLQGKTLEGYHSNQIFTHTHILAGELGYGLAERLELRARLPLARQFVTIKGGDGGSNLDKVGAAGDSIAQDVMDVDLGLHYAVSQATADEPQVSLGLDLSLPTGDDGEMLGRDRLGYRLLGALSRRIGTQVLHLNLGYRWVKGSWQRRLQRHVDLRQVSIATGVERPMGENLWGSLVLDAQVYDYGPGDTPFRAAGYGHPFATETETYEFTALRLIPGLAHRSGTTGISVGLPIGLNEQAPRAGLLLGFQTEF